jgi:hypothetical protein
VHIGEVQSVQVVDSSRFTPTLGAINVVSPFNVIFAEVLKPLSKVEFTNILLEDSVIDLDKFKPEA